MGGLVLGVRAGKVSRAGILATLSEGRKLDQAGRGEERKAPGREKARESRGPSRPRHLCPRLSGWCRCSISSGPHLFLFLCYASDTKHRHCSQDAQTSQTKPPRKPNVQNKIMYTRLAPASRLPSQRFWAWDSGGWGWGKQPAKGAGCPSHTQTGAGGESGKTGRPGQGWDADTCLTWEK